ncbi:hypothetical protein J45TS6_12650 [Paenibacillus sp. J45TS6]|uniref:DUF948 domain-containing protein n=1 Tax=unclassified Paenibacillus TaxID=185978 RepID=UPI001B1F006B|nr:DUF948 domain-containing protein [Paenibacillus sp. J45TS6]GIP42806.1 hypothetical protein J45TS6_12650 [Paenibacillus sp. J45TS6]
MIISISVAASAIAFIVLVYYVVRVLVKGMSTLSETNKTLSEVRNAIHGLTQESTKLIQTANVITSDVKGKIRSVEPIFNSAGDVGEAIHSVTKTVKQASEAIGDVIHPAAEQDTKKPVKIKFK